ncbi:MAG TPA: D-alanyl-D-alanine carboxypeptidase/D-alanyl-D-alanine-endopeptidase, partial [Anseongella sp.]|nr:D-alanyl-D-alanine carboxypeptidase/D-alanyl-D-alanine-endopeptidase [Anseongella sp.]
VLQGDIVIRGTGDPTLGSRRWKDTEEAAVLQSWVSAVKRQGITRVEGRIIGDQGLMGSQTIPGGWQWDDIGNYYGAGASALNWRENQFDILLQPSSVGGPVRITGTRPGMDYLEFVNELQTGAPGTGDKAYVYLPPYREVAYLRGTYAIDERERSVSAAVPDPAFECAYRFREALLKENIPVSAEATTSRRLELQGKALQGLAGTIMVSSSPPLDKIIYWFNQKSVNLYGESLLKTLALEAGKPGSTDAGVGVVRDFWAKRGIDTNSLAIADGSGLSPSNRVTASAMARVLLEARTQAWFGSFYSSLPEQNGLRMKSGFIQGVRAYAGYHTGSDGVPYVFVFIINNFNGSPSEVRLKMWRVLDALK